MCDEKSTIIYVTKSKTIVEPFPLTHILMQVTANFRIRFVQYVNLFQQCLEQFAIIIFRRCVFL